MLKAHYSYFLSLLMFNIALGNTVPEPQPEYGVKAALLLNFIRYTEWPDQVFQGPKSPIEVCIIGKDPFGNILEQTFSGKKIFDRELEVQRPTDTKNLTGCHVIFMGHLNNDKKHEVIKSTTGHPVLTVFDTNESNSLNGTISFIAAGETVQFEINLKTATKSGLKLSSRMIPLAKKVTR